MENKVLEQNLEQIKQYNPNLANKILMFNAKKTTIQLAQNENKEYNILKEGVAIHSTISTINEVKSIISSFEDKANSIKIIYGLGLGYLADEASKIIKDGKIIIYEPDVELIKFVLSIAQIDALYKENVFLCSDKSQLKECITKLVNEKTKLSISFLDYHIQNLDDIKEVLYWAQSLQGEIIANKNTLTKNAPQSLIQTLLNIKKISFLFFLSNHFMCLKIYLTL